MATPPSPPFRFTARLRKEGVNLYLVVPPSLSRRYGPKGHIPVKARVGGQWFSTTLVSRGGGRRVLFVNIPMLRAARAGLGDRVTITGRRDFRSRMPRVPPAVAKALQTRPHAARSWNNLTPGRRKEILRYLLSMKTEASLHRNVAKLRRILVAKRGRSSAGD